MSKKPKCPLIGQDGNIFNLMGIAKCCQNSKKYSSSIEKGAISCV